MGMEARPTCAETKFEEKKCEIKDYFETRKRIRENDVLPARRVRVARKPSVAD